MESAESALKLRVSSSHGVFQTLGMSQPGAGTFDGTGAGNAGRYHQMLTDSQVRTAKSTERPYKLADSRGLYLQIAPNGGRYWRFNYRCRGRQKTLALGTYPDGPLSRARKRHHEARRLLAEGVDPGLVKQAVSRDLEAVAR